MNAPSTGERIRAAREARGMSRPVLAGLVGRSTDWLKKIETGIRPLNSLELLVQMTRALGLDDVADLTGGEFTAPVRAWSTDVHHVVPGVRQALTRASFAVVEGDGPPAITPDELSRRVACLWRTWHRSDRQRSEVGAALPDLVLQAHASVRASDGAQRRACRTAAGDLYRLVQRLLAHICEPELHALAVERGRAFSEEADTAQSIAEAAWSSSVALCAAGHHEDAAALADRAAAALVASQTDRPGPAVAATLGALQLEAAAAHSLAGNMGDAYRYLDAAAATAGRMPRGA